MQNPRILHALEVIERVQQQELTTLSAELSDLRERQASLDAERKSVLERAREEAELCTDAARPFLSDYLRSVDRVQRHLEEACRELEAKADQLEDTLRKSFGEIKTTENVKDRTRQSIALAETKAEAKALDDVGRDTFLRLREIDRLA